MPDLLLSPPVRDALFAHARAGAAGDPPREVCGVLGGRQGDDADSIVTTTERVPNVADRPRTTYELDPEATIAAIETIEAAGRDHLGFYHSHPDGPRGPSQTDRRRATWPGFVYLIVSLADDPVIGAWRWTGAQFVQLRIGVATDADSDN